jgi:hypothetical protein
MSRQHRSGHSAGADAGDPPANEETNDAREAAEDPAAPVAEGDRGHNGPDPLRTVSDALQAASEALGMNPEDPGAGPAAYGVAGRVVYRASYGLSYCVIYPVVLLTRMVPKDNAVVHGLVDGAAAARDAAHGTRRGAPESDLAGDMATLSSQPA